MNARLTPFQIGVLSLLTLLVIGVLVFGAMFFHLQQQRLDIEQKQAQIELLKAKAAGTIQSAIELSPEFQKARDESITAADEGNLKQIATALEEYAVDHHGNYPKSLDTLPAVYMSSTPLNPANQKPYTYTVSGTTYEIFDSGGLNPETTRGLPGAPGCALVYKSGSGIEVVTGSRC